MEAAEILDAAALLDQAKTPAPSEIFEFCRKNPDGSRQWFRLRVRLLSTEENLQVMAAAQKEARERGEVGKDYGDIYRESQLDEVVARSLSHVEPGEVNGEKFWRRIFTSTEQLRSAFTETEIATCINMYEVVKARYGFLQDFSEDTVDEWVGKLSDPDFAPYFLAQLDSSAWPDLLGSLARRVQSLCESLGQPLPSWRDTLGSDQAPLPTGTGGSSGSSPRVTTDSRETTATTDLRIPSDRLLDSRGARKLAEQMGSPAPKKRDD